MKYCDLHTHSVFSDGTWTPAQLIREAERTGLGAVALTDHNTVDGLEDFLAAAEGSAVHAVPGVEFSTSYLDMELHVLALFVCREHYGRITEMLADAQLRKDESNAELVRRLRLAGYDIDYDRIKASTPNGSVNRAHIGAELTKLGYTASVQDAFRRLLSEKQGYYKAPRRIGTYDCIRFIRDIGAVAVLAHPLLTMTRAQTEAFLPDAVRAGLDAMETEYVTYDAETTAGARILADRFGLLHSGGSDFHGDHKPGIELGRGRGALAVDMACYEALSQLR